MKEQEIHFLNRTISHIRRVQDNMNLLERNRDKLPFLVNKWELVRRGMSHDLSKFSPALIDDYVLTNEYFRNKRLNLPNTIKVESLKTAWEVHERIELHHPKYKKSMSNLDLCEMCCDMSAMSQELNEKDYTKYFTITLCKDVPLVNSYKESCLSILRLLQELNNKGE